jgi:hypothetical protein
MAGMSLIEQNGRLILAHMTPSTPGAKVPRWRTRLRGAWLIKIAGKSVTTIDDARKVFESLSDNGAISAHLLFAHPEVRPDISFRGLPIISSELFSLLTHAQLNDCWEFSTVASHLSKKPLMFYRHADYLLGHIPPKYSPVYSSLVGTYSDANMDTATCVPT